MTTVQQLARYKQRLIDIKPREFKSCCKEVTETLYVLFDDIFGILKSGTAIDDRERLVVTDTLGVWLLRTRQFVEATNKLDSLNDCQSWLIQKLRTELLVVENCDFLFRYVIDFWNESGAALTNSLNDLLTKLIQLAKEVQSAALWKDLLDSWVSQALQIPSTMRVQYYLLHVLAPEADLAHVLDKRPDFIEHSLSLMWTESLATPIGKCIASLLINVFEHHYGNTSDFSAWFTLWEGPTMRFFHNPRMSERIEICILIPIFKVLDGTIFEQFLNRNFQSNSPDMIPILKIGQELGIEEEPFHEDRLVTVRFLEQLLRQDDYKLPVFELLTFSTKKSKTIPPYIYDVIRQNILVFFVDVEVKSRNAFHSSLKHFIDRIRDSAYSLNRDYLKLCSKNKFPQEQAQKLVMIDEAFSFIKWLVFFLKSQLAPGSQYQRQILATKILKTLVSSSLDPTIISRHLDPRLRMAFPFQVCLSQDETLKRLLIDDLSDNYNDVRDNCLQLLTIFAQSSSVEDKLASPQNDILFEKCLAFLDSYKGSEQGAKIAEYLFTISNDKHFFIRRLVLKLADKIECSSQNFTAGLKNPVNGYFLALSLLLRRRELAHEEKESEKILDTCISLIIKNWENVEFILCDDPFEKPADGIQVSCEVSDPQVLSYAFRSIKESAEMLRMLMSMPELSETQLYACGNLMLKQLLTIRHSGAFQSLIPSFAACCQRCNREYPSQLRTWLDNILVALETKTQFITRRSGGIPHIICSIVGSENSDNRPLLKLTFERLMKIARLQISEHEETVDLPQVNAFNCIKALFVESPLSDACAPYVYPSLVLCLQSFGSPLWSLRNCSFMLFSALQNRLFGKAGKNISARLFFARYDGVRGILREQFEESITTTMSFYKSGSEKYDSSSEVRPQNESIFLVLTVLSRLKQTPGFDGLEDFKNLVITCLESQNWMVRQLAARTLPTLVGDIPAQLFELLRELNSLCLGKNKAHGYILAITNLVKSTEQEPSHSIAEKFVPLVMQGIPGFILENSCLVTANAYVKLLEATLSRLSFKSNERNFAVAKLANVFVNLNDVYSTDGTKQLFLRSLLLVLLKIEHSDNLPDILALALLSPFFKVQIAAAEYISQNAKCGLFGSSVIVEALLQMLFDEDLWDYVRLPVLRALIALQVEISPKHLMKMVSNTHNDELRAIALEYVGLFLERIDNDYDEYVRLFSCDESPFEVRKSALISLIHATKRIPNLKMIFLIRRFLYDDDLELRAMSSAHINQFVLRLSSVEAMTGFSVTARMYVEKMKNNAEARSIAFETLKQELELLEFQPHGKARVDELFEVELENQFRNTVEELLNDVAILAVETDKREEIQSYVSSTIATLTSQMRTAQVHDSPAGWGSNCRLFAQLVVLRKLAQDFDVTGREEFDETLNMLNCHPLIFELTSGPY
ncbi:LANO_0F13498g1_1 [Lachancea nothofagi CBS 11611]|uniref:LANO_0F13498g1_1 n=1 Tax=Lachancea nothofagi CBS 11611 TaxID=1266666 RepID=A0A1G4KBS2_9SACH|nr:LANO_0F13498g1_1 [Lachancea nothofagi CBS 11611]